MRIRWCANTPHARLAVSFVAAIHVRRLFLYIPFYAAAEQHNRLYLDVKYLREIYSTALCVVSDNYKQGLLKQCLTRISLLEFMAFVPRQRVAAFIISISGMTFDPVPAHIQLFVQFVERNP